MENTKRKTLILKPSKRNLSRFTVICCITMRLWTFLIISRTCQGYFYKNDIWLTGRDAKKTGLPGRQIMMKSDLDKLRSDIGSCKLGTWKEIQWQVRWALGKIPVGINKATPMLHCVNYQVNNLHQSRSGKIIEPCYRNSAIHLWPGFCFPKKGLRQPFPSCTFRNSDEMSRHCTNDDNSFIVQVRQETEELKRYIGEVRKRL